jgi:hypothetical protein
MPVKRHYLRSYLYRREAEAFVDGLVAAGWKPDEAEAVEEPANNRRGVQYVVYKLEVLPDPVPSPVIRRRFNR